MLLEVEDFFLPANRAALATFLKTQGYKRTIESLIRDAGVCESVAKGLVKNIMRNRGW